MTEVKTFSTGDVSKPHRVPYWNDTLSMSFTRKFVEPYDASTFEGRFDIVKAGGCNIANIVQGASDVIHTWGHARCDNPAVTFHMQIFGETINAQDDRLIRLKPGSFTICDSERPYDVRMDNNMGLFVFKIPKDKFLKVCPLPKDSVCREYHGNSGSGKILTSFLHSFWRELLLGMPDAQADTMAEVGIGLIGNALTSANAEPSTQPHSHRRVYQIQEYIERHLCDTDLSPAEIARTFHMSTRNLHKIFVASQITVGNYIRKRRLERAREILSDRQFLDLSIADTALMVGFKNLAHFSSAFKAMYGLPPLQFKSSHLA